MRPKAGHELDNGRQTDATL